MISWPHASCARGTVNANKQNRTRSAKYFMMFSFQLTAQSDKQSVKFRVVFLVWITSVQSTDFSRGFCWLRENPTKVGTLNTTDISSLLNSDEVNAEWPPAPRREFGAPPEDCLL